MTGIAPGAYVRARGGMYDGATGRVLSVSSRATGPFALVDVGEAQPIAIFVSGLELVGAVPTVEQERDVLRREKTEWRMACLDAEQERDAAIAERDRMRRELEAVSDAVLSEVADLEAIYDKTRQRKFASEIAMLRGRIEARLDAILRGGES